MKNKIFLIIALACAICSSCSVDDQLDTSIQLKFDAKAMNILDPEPIIALENGFFSVLVSHPYGKVKSFTVSHNSGFEGFIDETEVLIANEVTVDANGVFSEPVINALIKYPVKASSIPGDILEAEFTFTDMEGKTVSTVARKKVVNFRSFSTQQYLYITRPVHSFYTGLSYVPTTAGTTFRDSIDVFWYRENNVHYIASPNADRTAQEFAARWPTVDFQQTEMRESRIIKLEGISLTEVDDATFASMDFTNAAETMEAEHNGVYGILLWDGRKAALEYVVYLVQYGRVRSKVQAAPAK